MSYFVRIHLTKEQLLPAIPILESVCERIIAYEHSEDITRIHCHLILTSVTVSTDTLKNYIRKHCPVPPRAGNKYWSFKQANDTHGAITYMSKGKYDPFVMKGFTQEEVEDSKGRWVERTPETSSKYQTRLQYVVRETPSQAKKRKNDLIIEMIAEINETNVARNSFETIKVIIHVLNSNSVVFGRYTVRDYYDTIQARVNTDSFATQMDYFCAYKT